MKKKVGIAIGAVVCAIVLGLGVYKSDASPQNPKLSVDDINQMVKDQYPGEIKELELEKVKNKAVYEVEVVSNGKEYELKLDGNTGEVLHLREREAAKNKENMALNDNQADQVDDKTKTKSTDAPQNMTEKEPKTDQSEIKMKEKSNDDTKEVKTENKVVVENKPKEESKPKAESKPKIENKKTVIDSNKAIAIAKSQFSGTVVEIELDDDDGRLIYEIEMKNGNEEAEFEIDAYTGKILVIDIERDDDDGDDD